MTAAVPPPSLASPSFLSRAAQLLSSSLAFDEALAHTVAAALPELGDFGFFDVIDDDTVRRTVAAHEAPDVRALLAPTQWQRSERSDINLCALSNNAPALHTGIDDAWYRDVAVAPPHLALLRQLAFRSMLTVPMRYRGELVGALTLFMARSGRQHDETHLAAAADLAALAAPIVVNTRLIEQHARAQAALRESDARLRLAIEAGEMGIWDWDVVEDRVTWTERVYALHGVPLGAFGGRVADFAALVHPDDAAQMHARISTALERGSSFTAEFRVIWPDGSLHWLVTRATVQRDANGAPLRMIGITHEVTERVELLQAEQRARSEADAANRAKDGFLAMLGHELRNPLAPIVSALQLIERQAPQALVEERRIVQRQVAHLTRLVDDLLDVARITRGDLHLDCRPLALRGVLAAALEMASPLLESRRHHVDAVLPSDEAAVEGDADRLAQVFANLLNNAARYTPEGGRIRLSVSGEGAHWRIEVQDNGQGIAPELLPRLFELFYQGRQGLDRAAGGLGVGLSLVRNLVALHGGSVEAHSEGPGRGSRFTVWLPRATLAAQPPAPPRVQAAGAALQILLVDDNRDAVEVLAQLLGCMGHGVHTASDPFAALQLAQERRFDAAILDLGLPGMDGYELARRLRALPGRAGCALIALSGYAQPEDRARSAAAGFAEHLVKPVDVEELLGALRAATHS